MMKYRKIKKIMKIELISRWRHFTYTTIIYKMSKTCSHKLCLLGSLSVPASMSELGREISPPASKISERCPKRCAQKGARKKVPACRASATQRHVQTPWWFIHIHTKGTPKRYMFQFCYNLYRCSYDFHSFLIGWHVCCLLV